MKKFLIGFALLTVGCSNQSLTGPSSSRSTGGPVVSAAGTTTPEESAGTHDPGNGATADAPSPTLRYSVDGPGGCVTAGTAPMQWSLHVTDAGASPIRFVALSHQSGAPGCAPTIEAPRERVKIGGALTYAPHASGQTIFSLDPGLYSCGHVQVDVSAFDANGTETLIVGMVIDYGKACPPPPPSERLLECAPQMQQAEPGQRVSLLARGGANTFGWTAPDGSPTTGNGESFSTAHSAPGTHAVTVTSGSQSATCLVVVAPPAVQALTCRVETPIVNTNQPAIVSAGGGTGTYLWTAAAGTPVSGQGPSFTTVFKDAGAQMISVSSGAQTATCSVTVKTPPAPTCEELNPPSFAATFPFDALGRLMPITGVADIRNAGTWKLTLHSTSDLSEYQANQPDFEQAVDTKTLACGERATLSVSAWYTVTQSKYWWITLERDGVRVHKSAFEINPAVQD